MGLRWPLSHCLAPGQQATGWGWGLPLGCLRPGVQGGHLARILQGQGGGLLTHIWPPKPGPAPGSLWYLRKRRPLHSHQPWTTPGPRWQVAAGWGSHKVVHGWDPLRQFCNWPVGRVTPQKQGPSSLLVVIGGIREGKLEAIGLSQQQADVPVTPAGSGQVLEEEEQLLKISFF